jgi:integrase
MRVWTAVEAGRFLEYLADDRLFAMWALLVTAGIRRGEALGLRWEDIDPDRRTVAIKRALVAVGYQVRTSEPKTSKGRRVEGSWLPIQ